MNMVSGIFEFADCDLIVALHNDIACSDAEWDSYLALLIPYKVKRRATDRLRGFTLTDGGGPNAKQRNRLVQTVDTTLESKLFRGAVISESATIRGIVTALQWLRPSGLKCFSPQQLGLAAAYDGVHENEMPQLIKQCEGLAKQVGCRTFERSQSRLQKVG